MVDTIIKGTGNSRTLKTIPNAAALYPDFDAFLAAMVAGTLPIDIGPLNPTGVQVQGTDLTKGNLLTDATAEGMGLTGGATPNDALAKLRALVATAQTSADQNAKSASGIFIGDGGNSKTLAFPFQPKLVVVSGYAASNAMSAYVLTLVSGVTKTEVIIGSSDNYRGDVSWSGNSVTWSKDYNNYSFNASGFTYVYTAIG